MSVAVVTNLAVNVIIDTVARKQSGASIHAVFKCWLDVFVDNLGCLTRSTGHVENLKNVSGYELSKRESDLFTSPPMLLKGSPSAKGQAVEQRTESECSDSCSGGAVMYA